MAAVTHPKWTRVDMLFPAVPWLWRSDFTPGMRATWELDSAEASERISCWPVPVYDFDGSTTAFVMVHAVRGNGNDGGEIALSLSPAPRYDWYARAVLDNGPNQSAPQRHMT